MAARVRRTTGHFSRRAHPPPAPFRWLLLCAVEEGDGMKEYGRVIYFLRELEKGEAVEKGGRSNAFEYPK